MFYIGIFIWYSGNQKLLLICTLRLCLYNNAWLPGGTSRFWWALWINMLLVDVNCVLLKLYRNWWIVYRNTMDRVFVIIFQTGVLYSSDMVTNFHWNTLIIPFMCELSHSVVSDSLWPHGPEPICLLCPWGFSRQEFSRARVGCHALLQEIFPTQGSNPHLPHCRRILYHLSYPGRPIPFILICNFK